MTSHYLYSEILTPHHESCLLLTLSPSTRLLTCLGTLVFYRQASHSLVHTEPCPPWLPQPDFSSSPEPTCPFPSRHSAHQVSGLGVIISDMSSLTIPSTTALPFYPLTMIYLIFFPSLEHLSLLGVTFIYLWLVVHPPH